MFLADVPNASLVETAIITGRLFLKCAFVASVTDVSLIPLASFPRVLPVHGAITNASSSFFGPIGSASFFVEIIYFLYT